MASQAELVSRKPEPPAPVAERRDTAPGSIGEKLNARPAVVAQRAAADTLSIARAPNRTGLPDKLKTGVEALSGISLDDVRVHRNSSAPAQMQAHAFAQGSDIHLAPGQEQHLPHEAWHVVQQKQGRVRATMQLKSGVAINDDAGLEAEADVMGARAVAGGHAVASPVERMADKGVVQRAIGFEFETDNVIFDAEDKAKNLAKEHVYAAERFHIDADTRAKQGGHHIEFVTEPVNTDDEAFDVIDEMVKFAEGLAKGKVGPGNGWNGEYEIVIEKANWSATMQHTEGVLLTDMASFLKRTAKVAKDMKKHAAPIAALEERHQALAAAPATALAAPVKGLIHLILHYLRTLGSWDGKQNEEGPKNAGTIMSRTDFHSIYQSLTVAERAQFRQRIQTDIEGAGFAMNGPVFGNPYLQYDQGKPDPKLKENATTVRAWMQSIYEGYDTDGADGEHVAKDHLSPPDGYEVFDPAYSMGAMDMVDGMVVIEVREHGDSTILTIDQWSTAVDAARGN